MAVCGICGQDATVILSQRDAAPGAAPLAARAFCTPCWRREGEALARLLPLPPWRLEVRDPELTGIPRERVEYFLTLERVAAEADLQAIAAGLRQRVRDSGRPLPPELVKFVERHARPST